MDEVRKHVGKKIREFRQEKKLSQKQLGLKVGMKHNTISGYENGKNEAELDVLYRIAKVLEKNINEFFPETTEIHDELSGLEEDDILLMENIRKKALQLEGEDREKLMSSIKFAVDFFDNSNK